MLKIRFTMKRFMFLMSLFAMMAVSMELSAQEITITLNFGWNWISYTQPDTLDFATALENFTPVQGDRILSKNTSATYVNGQWRGNLQQFTPGWGYMYYSNRTETVSLVFGTGVPQVTVITTEPTSITTTSAICGGTVTAGEASHVFVRGLCWNTSPNPVYDDNHTSDGTNTGTLSNTLEGLSPNTTYYVRAYVVSDSGLSYGNEVSFTTNDHDYVDLGLPSGLLWATCNVGADSPEKYGDYFAWGETQLKDNYDWNAYQYCNGSYNTLTKYCNDSYYGYNGFTDNLFALLPEDDAATATLGGGLAYAFQS